MEHKIVKKSQVFPPSEEFERAMKRITRSERRTNIGLASNASDEEKAKYKFCKTIACYTIENDISELDLAKKLGISHSRVEKVLFCHIDELDLKE
jgi:dephospho-CoA kinase